MALPDFRPRVTRTRQRGLNGFGAVVPWYLQGKADGVDPTLWADFINNRYAVNGVAVPFADVFTHTRASTATYFDATGVMQNAAVDTPRFDYDPVTLLPKGLLIEEQRTNLQLNSNTPFTSWVPVVSTKTAAASNFLGFIDGCEVASQGNTLNRIQGLPFSWTSGTVYSWTAYVKAGIGGQVLINIRNDPASTETRISGAVGGALTVTSTAAGTATYIGSVAVQGGYIITGTFTPNANTAGGIFGISPNSATIGDSVIVYAGQFEAGAFPTSFIPTTTSAVTRSADQCSNTSSNVITPSSWMSSTAHTLYTERTHTGSVDGNSIYLGTPAGNNLFMQKYYFLLNQFFVTDNWVTQASWLSGTQPINTPYKRACSGQVNDYTDYRNGVSLGTDAAGTMPLFDRLVLANANANDAHLKELRYYPIRVTNSELARIKT